MHRRLTSRFEVETLTIMDPKTLETFRQRLQTRQAELLAQSAGSADSRQAVTLDQQSVGRVSRIDAMQQQQMAQAQERQRSHELVRIQQALTRLDEGEFGWCTECGEQIAPGRLEIDPSIPTCVKCAGR